MKKCKHPGCNQTLSEQDIEDYYNLCYRHGEDAIEEADERRRERIALANEY